jgi:hypothetical protein
MNLSDFIGGAAETGAGLIGSRIEQDQRTEAAKSLADHNQELDIAKQRVLQQMKTEAEEAQYGKNRERAAAEGQAIESGAKDVQRARVSGLIGAKSGTPLTDEQAAVIMESPETMEHNGIKPQTRAQGYDDKVATAERMGLMGQAKDLRGQQDVEIKRDSEARRLSTDEKRTEALALETQRKTRADELRYALDAKRTDALIAKISSGGGDKAEKVMSYMEGRRKEIASESTEIKNQMAVEMKAAAVNISTPEEIAAIKASYQPRLDQIAKDRQQMDADFSHLREKFNLPPAAAPQDKQPGNATTINALPDGAKQIGTSGGKPVYQTPDGKKFIAK